MNNESNDQPDVIAFPPLIFASNAVLAAAAHWMFPLRPFAAFPSRIAGAGLALLAGGLALWAGRTMGKVGTNVRPDWPTLAIAAVGPYAFTRNPMYVSLCALQLGIGLLLHGVLPVLFVVPLALVLHFGVVKREERYLAAKFGENYLAYQRRVRRWF